MFLHDGLGAIESWRDFPDRACAPRGGDVLLYDRWGHAGSAPRDRFAAGFMEAEAVFLAALLEEFCWDRVDLIGHSDGATIALLFAAAWPDRVRRVVSIAAHCFVEPATTRSIQRLLAAWHAGRPAAWLPRLHGERAGALLSAWAEVWLSAEHAAWDILDQLPRIRCPVLALQGVDDEYGTLAQLDAIDAGVADVRVEAVEAAGHSPHVDHPVEIAAKIAAFLGADS